MELGAAYQTEGRAIVLVRTAGAGFTQVGQKGLATPVTRTSAGLYVVTTLVAAPAATSRSILTLNGLADGSGVVSHTSDTVKTISTFNQAGAATDIDFDFSIEQLS